jgi:transcriptional regulator with XRE-family HTH domain
MSGRMSDAEFKQFVCKNLKLARLATGLRLAAFARRLEVSPQALANYEAGYRIPPPQALVRACEEFGFTADWFYRGLRQGLAHELAIKLRDVDEFRNGGKNG